LTLPGKPTEDGISKFYNGRMHDECLNVSEFVTLKDAREALRA
jgi:putative transposase